MHDVAMPATPPMIAALAAAPSPPIRIGVVALSAQADAAVDAMAGTMAGIAFLLLEGDAVPGGVSIFEQQAGELESAERAQRELRACEPPGIGLSVDCLSGVSALRGAYENQHRVYGLGDVVSLRGCVRISR
jgi:hypothetical protein